MQLELGISPCPNDTWIFYALANNKIDLPFDITMYMADVEDLNIRARKSDIAATKLSVAAMVDCLDDYILLRTGGALGRGCGPIVVTKQDTCFQSAREADKKVAIPGKLTTANMLLSLNNSLKGERVEMIFDEVMPAVQSGTVDAGVVIHEGRFTYENFGLKKVLDLGQWWENTTNLPLPLGAIAIRRDLGMDAARQLEKAIRASLSYVQQNPEEATAYIKEHAQEMDDAVIKEHIATFVNEFSMELGTDGEYAIQLLLEKAFDIAGKPMPDLPIFVTD
ncbi:1,4-dihydroxy-6-naphthoate synthase [Halodesulfovibrio marinisediminis]|uniref:1,4-dihydroxy-6-naphtoate synthase n=1 Tax=Halodesulfovibrio marinisediminis DSM 17456 TaxID=1121457 RepID=A0A1N6H9I1_9BACT|nr:1,4-dihydroxy-6-naphthoate synthase [Halodesulfovibrio marinisediminis]SIO16432.1 1,4-dihydroxy-6-naphthoate synthase [Halodesulfovibrio marinisediminis DSM 17456]